MDYEFLTGEGLGKYQQLKVIDKTDSMWRNPHNEYLLVYFELGLFGLLFALGYLVNLFKRFLKVKTEQSLLLFSCITALLVNCMGHFPFQIAPTAFLAITYFALLEICLIPQPILLKN